MKTAISVPDELFEEADRLARRLKRSRSRVYTDAVREYVVRHDPDAVTAALDRVYSVPESDMDSVISRAGQHVLQQVDW
jgi:metal-responsive CopG/Arc/MetJ family transcriptional regulator